MRLRLPIAVLLVTALGFCGARLHAQETQDLHETVRNLQAQHNREVAELRALTTALAHELDGVHARLEQLTKDEEE